MSDSIYETGEAVDISLAGEEIDAIEFSINYEREIEEVPEEYELEYFHDKYGGIVIPVPVNRHKTMPIQVGEEVTGAIKAAPPLPAAVKNQQPTTLRIHTDPEIVINGVVFQHIEFGGDTWMGEFTGTP